MNGKKLLAGVAAVAVACTLSVGGTLAYLTATTDQVTNTFVVGSILDPVNGNLKLEENQPVRQSDGTYELDEDVFVTQGAYSAVLPGDELPKNPTIKVTGLSADAYVFVEVVDGTHDLDFSIASGWTLLPGVTGEHSGAVYAAPKVAAADSWSKEILADNTVSVDDDATGSLGSLSFYGYLCQANGFATAAAAWAACFGA